MELCNKLLAQGKDWENEKLLEKWPSYWNTKCEQLYLWPAMKGTPTWIYVQISQWIW